MNKHIDEMVRFMLEKSNSANVEPIFTAHDGTEIVLGEQATKLLDDVLEQAFIPFLAECLVKEGYRKASEGEWVDRYKGQFANPIYVCSVCGKGTLLTPHINELGQMEMVQAFSHFCPNCGAKMKYESEGADDDL